MFSVKQFLLVGAIAAVSVLSPDAQAQSIDACVSSNADGQVLQNQGQLLAAVEKFQSCAVQACPEEIRRDCGTAMLAARAIVPSVVIAVRRGDEDVMDALVLIDNSRNPVRLDGRPIELDPGPHVIRVHHGDKDAIERQLVLRQGERNRLVSIELPIRTRPTPVAPTRPAPPSQPEHPSPLPSRRPPTATLIAGGVGVVGAGLFGAFAWAGKVQEAELERCRPACESSSVHVMRQRYLIADVSLGVSVLSFATAAWFWWAPEEPSAPRVGAMLGLDKNGTLGVSALGRF
ncbi:MAG: hypothetical protein SFV15_08385 [Polyangiaceae bacterium]|nr:hypothetical protein [Polyangiaceae bacterium]